MSNQFDSILDACLDDLADLPEFGVYPAGAHRVTIEFAKKEINGKQAIEAAFNLVEHLELTDPTATPMSAGAKGSVLYFLDNEFAQGQLKAVLKPIAESLGASRLGDVIDQAKGMEVVIVTKQRMNKDKTQTYCDIKKLIVE